MKKYLWPVSGLMATVLAGVAVMVGPFALHLNSGGHWVTATESMFWSGVGIIVVALVAMMMWQRELAQAIMEAEENLHPTPVEAPAVSAEAESVSSEAQWETELAKLAEAVLQDLKAETASSKPKEAVPADLQAVASALLQDLSQRMDHVGVDGGGQGGRYS